MSMILRWRTLLWSTLLTFGTGSLLALLLSAGLADPPYAGPVQWSANSYTDWDVSAVNENLEVFRAPVTLPYDDFTLEITARNNGGPASAWGVTLSPLVILIDNQGYFSVTRRASPDWVEFIHIQPQQSNTLTLHIERAQATLRINHEIAWSGDVATNSTWGIITFRQPQLAGEQIALYWPA